MPMQTPRLHWFSCRFLPDFIIIHTIDEQIMNGALRIVHPNSLQDLGRSLKPLLRRDQPRSVGSENTSAEGARFVAFAT
jgi:hypothetical protein